MPRGYEVKSEHSVDEVFDVIRNGASKFGQHKASVSCMRLLNFFHHGVSCIECGITGNIFRVERDRTAVGKHKYGNWHLNLYVKEGSGRPTLMTMDHIIPRSRGGDTSLENLQPMCEKCNSRKGNLLPGEKRPDKVSVSKERRGKRIRVICWGRMFRLSWLWRAFKHSVTHFELPYLPKKIIRSKNRRWYDIEVRKWNKHLVKKRKQKYAKLNHVAVMTRPQLVHPKGEDVVKN